MNVVYFIFSPLMCVHSETMNEGRSTITFHLFYVFHILSVNWIEKRLGT